MSLVEQLPPGAFTLSGHVAGPAVNLGRNRYNKSQLIFMDEGELRAANSAFGFPNPEVADRLAAATAELDQATAKIAELEQTIADLEKTVGFKAHVPGLEEKLAGLEQQLSEEKDAHAAELAAVHADLDEKIKAAVAAAAPKPAAKKAAKPKRVAKKTGVKS